MFDGRYRFSRYFSPIHFNRPTTYEALVANNDLEVYDLQEDPEETRNLEPYEAVVVASEFQCRLLGVKRTCAGDAGMSACEPKRTNFVVLME